LVLSKMIILLGVRILIGILAGLMINFIADVLPETRRLSHPVCSACAKAFSLKTYLLGLKCSSCGQPRGARFFIVLVSAAALSLLLGFFPFANLGYWAALPILIYFGVVVVIDIEHHLVLFQTSLFGFGLMAIYGILLHGLSGALLGALGGFIITFLFYLLGIGFTKIIGKLRGQTIKTVAFGFGDVSAGTVLGLLTGWPGIAGAIIIALLFFGVLSLVYVIGLVIARRYQSFTTALPFAPFLVLGVVTIFYL